MAGRLTDSCALSSPHPTTRLKDAYPKVRGRLGRHLTCLGLILACFDHDPRKKGYGPCGSFGYFLLSRVDFRGRTQLTQPVDIVIGLIYGRLSFADSHQY